MFSKQIILAIAVQAMLLFITTILLIQPRLLIGELTARARSIAFSCGIVFFCLSFCWSVILGSLWTLHRLTHL